MQKPHVTNWSQPAGVSLLQRFFIDWRLADASEWQELTHEFEVKEGGRDVDLVCESDAYAGTAWFDLNSLFVRKR